LTDLPPASEAATLKVAYFLTHPVQYQSPLLRHLAAAGLDVTTVYSDVSTAGRYFDPDYRQEVSWEQPLLEGYPHAVLRTPLLTYSPWSWKKRVRAWLLQHRPEVVWVHGWGTAFALGALLAAQECRLPILLRGEAHLQGLRGSWLWRKAHKAVLSRLFTQVDQFLAIGSANAAFYRDYGVAVERITLVPYVTDNDHFQAACVRARPQRETLRGQWGIAPGRSVLLFVGRLSQEKGLATLLEALRLLDEKERPWLLVGGDGPLSRRLRRLAAASLGNDVKFLGFVSPSRLPALYDLCDALVLPSQHEPWGMVVNEVMNAGKPLILSDRVGCAHDLLKEGENGLSFPAGNPQALAEVIRRVIHDPEFRDRAGAASLRIVSRWNTGLAVAGLRTALARVALASSKRHLAWTQPPQRSGIELAYIGLHEVFQLAIAAHELGQLHGLQCSVLDAPGKLGRQAARFMRLPSARPLGAEVLPLAKVIEQPVPLLTFRMHHAWRRRRKTDPLWHHHLFEALASRRLAGSAAAIAVGAETCSLAWFEAAKRRGMQCVLDAHGIPTPFLDGAMRRGAADFDLPPLAPSDSEAMTWHKRQERKLADVILLCSPLQKEIYARLGEDTSRMRPVPLWVDTTFWHSTRPRMPAALPLRVMFAGTATLAKGLPYLFQALEQAGDAVHLTLVGPLAPGIRHLAEPIRSRLTVRPYMSREELRDFYATQHLLVLPSLGDSFGFVALEAMACGLPVILTDHCGAPVPEPAWRVPAHDSLALANRLRHYVDDPARLAEDGEIARRFAQQFSPQRYRDQVKEIYQSLLAAEM
jgi:glycosyltransferase involved in cell wall biosynthesis